VNTTAEFSYRRRFADIRFCAHFILLDIRSLFVHFPHAMKVHKSIQKNTETTKIQNKAKT